MLLLLCTAGISHAQLLQESFSYGSTADTLTNPAIGGANWKRHSGTGGPLQYLNTSLSYQGYTLSGQGGSVGLTHASTSREDANRPFSSAVATGTVYTSFMLSVSNSGGTTGDYFFHLNDTNGNGLPNNVFKGRVFVKDGGTTGTFKLGLSKSGAATAAVFTSADYNTNQTYLVVVKYVFRPSASDDSVYATILSQGIPSTEPVFALAAADVATSDLTKVKSTCIRQGTAGTGAMTIDGILAGTSWQDIVGAPTVVLPTAVSNAALSSITRNTATLSWTKPQDYVNDSMTTLVFIKSGNNTIVAGVPSAHPSIYLPSADFSGNGSTYEADVNAKCVFNGDTNMVQITGLNLATRYQVLVYVVRNADSAYSTGVALSGQTLANPIAVSSLSFAANSQSAATITWNKPQDYADNTHVTLVYLKEINQITTNTPTANPDTINAGAQFGSGSVLESDAAAYCVYKGDSNAVVVMGLTVGTLYQVVAVTYRSVDQTYSPFAAAAGSTFGVIVPPGAPSGFSRLSATRNTANLIWVKNQFYTDSSMTMVVYVKKGGSVNQLQNKVAPADITDSPVFGSGSKLVSDSLAFCIYKGDGEQVSVSGLEEATLYAFVAYAIRESDTVYSAALTGVFSTLSPPASTGLITFPSRGLTELTVAWGLPNPNDPQTTSMVTFIKQGSPIIGGSQQVGAGAYTASTTFGQGSTLPTDPNAYCISNGQQTSVTVTGLIQDTTYYVLTYVIRTDSAYSPPVTASVKTRQPAPTAASAVTVTGTGIATATARWTKPQVYTNTGFNTLVFVKRGSAITGAPFGPASKYTNNSTIGLGTRLESDTLATCAYRGDTTFVNLLGLAKETGYHVAVFVLRESDTTYSTVAAGNGSTLGTPPVYTIGSISTINPTTGVPDSNNVRVTVRGLVYGSNQRTTGLQFVLRDATGGTTVFITNKNFGYTVTEGDSIEVQGVVTTFRGLHEVASLDTIIVLGSGKTLKEPTTVAKVEEAGENDLLRINGVRFLNPPAGTNWPTTSSNIQVLNANNDTITLRILSTFSIAGKPLPATPVFDVIGLGTQFSTSTASPFAFTGYQLFPRTEADIIAIPQEVDSLTPFELLEPADSVVITINNNNLNDSVAIRWTASTRTLGTDPVLYSFVLDTLGGDFGTPYATLDVGQDTVLYIRYSEIVDQVFIPLNVPQNGGTFAGIWTVAAESDTVGRMAENTHRIYLVNATSPINGLLERTIASRISVYPNPAHGSTTVYGVERNDEVILTDLTGKTIFSYKAEATKAVVIPTLDLELGIYLVRVQSGNASHTAKVVVH